MGWFDESSDDEEHNNNAASRENQRRKQIESFALETAGEETKPNQDGTAIGVAVAEQQHAQHDGEETEEDPLDAYMKTLESAPTVIQPTRLDIENEEEATSHWENEPTQQLLPNPNDDGDSDGDDPFAPRGSRAARAQQALASTFHKAGGTKRNADTFESSSIIAAAAAAAAAPAVEYAPFRKEFWNPTDTTAGRQWRKTHSVTCSISIDPVHHFAEFAHVFGTSLTAAVTKAGFSVPTAVQSQTIPVALAGKDALVTAATGQGKTLAYVWPIAVHLADQPVLRADENGPLALVLVPTRELAIQVQKQAKPMLAAVQCTVKVVIGGQGKYILQQELKRSGGVELVVATPGRLLDTLSDKKGLSLRRVTFLVLDEADKMLQMGFEVQVRQILSQIRRDRQTLLLSATMGRRMETVAAEWLQRDYVRISVGRTGESSRNVEQHVMVLPNEDAKRAFLLEMLPIFQDVGRTIVFVATREGCETLATLVRKRLPEFAVDTLHGDKHQSDRNAALRAFTKGRIAVMIATDVAARGLDVPQVATVLNFDPAKNLDGHVHRIGRAGRLKDNEQQTGSAYTLLTPWNADFAHVLRGAFEREGRVVSPELLELAQKSRQSGNVAARNNRNKSGLGFDDRDANRSVEASSPATKDMYYGPSSNTDAPQPKRSRWS
jgi:ATP-dependent RNA helicase DDX42